MLCTAELASQPCCASVSSFVRTGIRGGLSHGATAGIQWVNIVTPLLQSFRLRTFKDVSMHLVPARNQNLYHQQRAWVNHSLPSVSDCWQSFSSTISHFLPHLWSVALLACSLDASPWMPAVVLYFSRYCSIRLKMFSLFLCLFFMYCLCEKYSAM